MADKSQRERKPDEPLAHYEKAGATLLSEQPSDPVTNKLSPKKAAEWAALRGHLEAHLLAMRNWRQSWWSTNWSQLAQYIEPRRSIWLTQSSGGVPSPNNMNRGKPINSSIVDPTGTYAVRVCSAGLVSGLASVSRPWFKIMPSMKNTSIDAAARKWLDDTEERIYTVLAGSNFYNSFAQECEDLVVFGTAPVIIYEDDKDLIRCYNPTIGEYYLGTSATMRVDCLDRNFLMNVTQMVDFFGAESCPADVQMLWKQKGNGLDYERIIAHSIEPNFDIEGCPAIPGNFTWREVYWVYGNSGAYPLSQRGFVDQPFTAARWTTQSNDAYGRSVGMDVLPDIIQLQVETMRKAEAIEKQVRPPLLGGMELKNQPSSILPGHVTYVQNMGTGQGLRPIYEVNPDIKGMMEDLKEIQGRIKTGFFNDLFLMLEQIAGEKMTAYEVAQKMQEKLQVLGPVIENIINESLKPRLKRVYGIMQRKGLIDPPPDSLKGVPLDLHFVSMLALAQKAAATGGLERLAGIIGNMVAVYPEVKDNLDPDVFIREMNDLLGNPQKILRGPEQVAEMRQQQNQAAQAEKAQQDIERGVQTAAVGADAANVLSQTHVGGNQILQQMLSPQ